MAILVSASFFETYGNGRSILDMHLLGIHISIGKKRYEQGEMMTMTTPDLETRGYPDRLDGHNVLSGDER